MSSYDFMFHVGNCGLLKFAKGNIKCANVNRICREYPKIPGIGKKSADLPSQLLTAKFKSILGFVDLHEFSIVPQSA